MTTPLGPAEVERVLAERADAYEAQDAIMEQLRSHAINIDECTRLSNAIVWPRWSRHSIGPCMPGCKEKHGPGDATEDTVPHRVTVGTVPSTRAGGLVTVEYGFVDNLVEGTRSEAEIVVNCADDGLGPATARVLAGHLVRAAALVEHWNLQQQGGVR